ncbi:MAG: hypothetical protein KGS72_01335 [Cyanobacteria bacterium REEB67]|nr:hypothetical protein [Cyanobacteria bacterium REEB67]
MTETKPLPLNNVAFNFPAAESTPLAVGNHFWVGMTVMLICAGPNRVQYFCTSPSRPNLQRDLHGFVEPGTQSSIRIPDVGGDPVTMHVMAPAGAVCGAAYLGPIRIFGKAADVDDACLYIRKLFGLAVSEMPSRSETLDWKREVRAFLLAEGIVAGVFDFQNLVQVFQNTADQQEQKNLIRKMDLIDSKLSADLAELKVLSKDTSQFSELVHSIRGDATYRFNYNHECLLSIRHDPSLAIKPWFTAS